MAAQGSNSVHRSAATTTGDGPLHLSWRTLEPAFEVVNVAIKVEKALASRRACRVQYLAYTVVIPTSGHQATVD